MHSKIIILILALAMLIKIPVSAEELPNVDTNMFCYESHKAITNTRSKSYKYLQHCTPNEYGIMEYDGYYAVAMSDFYGDDIGDTFHVILENGTEFDVFIADRKGRGCTDDQNMGSPIQNYDGEDCLNVLEFVIDNSATPREVKRAGTFSVLDDFGGLYGNGGNIRSIEYTGHLDLRKD